MKIYFILKFYNAISCIDKCTFLKCKGSLQITKLPFVKCILCEDFVLYKKEQNRTQNSKKIFSYTFVYNSISTKHYQRM